jgi:hypothetical protein
MLVMETTGRDFEELFIYPNRMDGYVEMIENGFM